MPLHTLNTLNIQVCFRVNFTFRYPGTGTRNTPFCSSKVTVEWRGYTCNLRSIKHTHVNTFIHKHACLNTLHTDIPLAHKFCEGLLHILYFSQPRQKDKHTTSLWMSSTSSLLGAPAPHKHTLLSFNYLKYDLQFLNIQQRYKAFHVLLVSQNY